jgi:hypothetical protein
MHLQDVYLLEVYKFMTQQDPKFTGANRWLEKKDMSYLQEYQDITGTSAAQGQPKYYASFGGATGASDTTSGRIFLSPTPNTTYRFS